MAAYVNMPQERITDKRDGQVVISCGIGLQRRKSIGRILQGNGQGLKWLDWDYELVFVNDGSADGSLAILDSLAERDSRVKVVSFSRNFGHEAAMIAGLDYSSGDAVVCMDADLQHPPECIPRILEKMAQATR